MKAWCVHLSPNSRAEQTNCRSTCYQTNSLPYVHQNGWKNYIAETCFGALVAVSASGSNCESIFLLINDELLQWF